MASPFPTGGRRVLIVEDEAMIRLMLGEMLEDLGYVVAAESGRLDEALEYAKTLDFDVAILDVNLNGETIVPVIDAIKARGGNFALITGYGQEGLPPELRSYVALQKPFQMDALDSVLRRIAAGAAA